MSAAHLKNNSYSYADAESIVSLLLRLRLVVHPNGCGATPSQSRHCGDKVVTTNCDVQSPNRYWRCERDPDTINLA